MNRLLFAFSLQESIYEPTEYLSVSGIMPSRFIQDVANTRVSLYRLGRKEAETSSFKRKHLRPCDACRPELSRLGPLLLQACPPPPPGSAIKGLAPGPRSRGAQGRRGPKPPRPVRLPRASEQVHGEGKTPGRLSDPTWAEAPVQVSHSRLLLCPSNTGLASRSQETSVHGSETSSLQSPKRNCNFAKDKQQ